MAFAPTPPNNLTGSTMLSTAQLAASIANITGGGGGGGTSYSLAITNDPATGTIGSVIDFSGTVAPSGQAVQFGLSTNATIFSGGTFAGGTLGGATVSGTIWNAYETLNTAGTFYPFGEITGQTTVVGSGIVVSSPSTPLTFSYISGSGPSSGSNAGSALSVTPYSSSVNLVTPLAHGSSVTPEVNYGGTNSTSAASGVFWYDTSATNTSSTAGTVASGTVQNSVGNPGGVFFAFYAGSAPSAAGTYYGKFAIWTGAGGTGTLMGVFVTQAITVT